MEEGLEGQLLRNHTGTGKVSDYIQCDGRPLKMFSRGSWHLIYIFKDHSRSCKSMKSNTQQRLQVREDMAFVKKKKEKRKPPSPVERGSSRG